MFLKNKKKAESSLNERLTLAFNQSVKQKETLFTLGSFIPIFKHREDESVSTSDSYWVRVLI